MVVTLHVAETTTPAAAHGVPAGTDVVVTGEIAEAGVGRRSETWEARRTRRGRQRRAKRGFQEAAGATREGGGAGGAVAR